MYKKILFISLFLLNVALYVPSTAEVHADLAGEIIKKADTTMISKLSDEAAMKTISGIYEKARNAKVAEFALERGLSLEEYNKIMQGQYPACITETAGGALGMISTFSQLDDMVKQDILKANFGLDQTLTTEAFKQYSEQVTNMLETNKKQYIKMYKEGVKEMYKQVMDIYQKFPSPPITSCS